MTPADSSKTSRICAGGLARCDVLPQVQSLLPGPDLCLERGRRCARARSSPRPSAAPAVRALQDELGVEVALLTGDRAGPARAAARALGLRGGVFAELLPAEKLARVAELEAARGGGVGAESGGEEDGPHDEELQEEEQLRHELVTVGQVHRDVVRAPALLQQQQPSR